MSGAAKITQLLESAQQGDAKAAAELLPAVYDELRQLARVRLGRLAAGQTLQPTALVHEAYLRIAGATSASFANQAHFFFAAARAMRQILVDQARSKASLKRGGDYRRVEGPALAAALDTPVEDMLALDDALQDLEEKYPRKFQLVMLRFFSGLTNAQAADVLQIAESTAERDWAFVRTYLFAIMNPEATDDV